jgi:hypothetical protein
MARERPADCDAFGDGPAPADVPGLPAVFRTPEDRPAHGWRYTPELGELVAELYVDDASAGGLWALHAAMPDRIPPPRVLAVWKRQFPAFGQLLAAAEKVRAARLMEECVVIADTDPRAAPKVALSIAARQRLAESLDAATWGKGQSGTPASAPALTADQPTAVTLSDDELAALALAGRADGATGGGSPP